MPGIFLPDFSNYSTTTELSLPLFDGFSRLKDGQSRLLTSTIGGTFVHSLLSETVEAFPCRMVIVSGSGVLSLLKAADKNGLVKGRCVVLDGNERIIQRVSVKMRKHLKSALIQETFIHQR